MTATPAAIDAAPALFNLDEHGAEMTDDGRYRYRLWRRWGTGRHLGFVMLNPSTADAVADDPTIRRCIGFAKREGLDGIEVVNLYAWRATHPTDLWRALHHGDDIVGPANDIAIATLAGNPRIDAVVLAWGAIPGQALEQSRRVAALIATAGAAAGIDRTPLCLGTTALGEPRHPLMLRADTPLHEWTAP